VLDAHLATIARVNPQLNAIVTLWPTPLAFGWDAEGRDARRLLGPLHGLRRDQGRDATAGIRTTYGSPLFRDTCRARTRAVRRLKGPAPSCSASQHAEFAAGANTSTKCSASLASLDPALSRRVIRRIGGGGATGHGALAQAHDFGCSIDVRRRSRHCRHPADTGLTPNAPMPLAGSRPGHGPLRVPRGCRADAGRWSAQPDVADLG